MSFKRKFISAVTSAFAVIAFTTFVSAQETNTSKENNSMQKQEMRQNRGGKRGFGNREKRGGGDRMLMRSLGKLNLTDAQKEQVRVISDNFKLSTQSLRDELRGLGMKKRDGIISADEQTRTKELKSQLKISGDQMQNSLLAVLNAEQRAQFDKMKEEMKQRMQERRQNRQNRQNQTLPQSEIN